MVARTNSDQLSVDKIVDHIFAKRRINRLEQQLLMASLRERDTLSEEDMILIDRVFDLA